MRVDQVLCDAGPVDAVTNQGLACRSLFERWGWEGRDYAVVIAPGMARHTMRHLHELSPAGEDVLLLHYSGYARGLERLFGARRRSLLISHNITPSRYFWAHDPAEAVRCELGRSQLAELAIGVGALAGVSDYNAEELRSLSGREAEVIPVLFDRASLPAAVPSPSGPPTIVFVGRLVPHKRQDLVIRAFARYRRREPEAQLILIGTPLSPAYGVALHRLAEEVVPGGVRFESGVSVERLAEHYRSADAFLCLSEHEGFCIPLLEAFHFGVPVIARDVGAIGEVVDDAAILLSAQDDLDVVAELLHIVVGDAELRAELHRRGERRLALYEYAHTAESLRQAVLSVAAA